MGAGRAGRAGSSACAGSAEGGTGARADEHGEAAAAALRLDEFDDLVALLRAHAAPTLDDAPWLVFAVAAGCLGDDHLWQDMGLPDRAALSALFARHFPSLAARNDRDMKWKKFLYLQLCEQAEIRACRAPSCAVCRDYPACFGDETGPARVGARPAGARPPGA
jgi:nitrogen fixation protein NifQ